jgi:hypothetical protein
MRFVVTGIAMEGEMSKGTLVVPDGEPGFLLWDDATGINRCREWLQNKADKVERTPEPERRKFWIVEVNCVREIECLRYDDSYLQMWQADIGCSRHYFSDNQLFHSEQAALRQLVSEKEKKFEEFKKYLDGLKERLLIK